MDKFPLIWAGNPVGELTVEREALYTWFTARCHLPEEGLWCAWVVGAEGELRLGILEPNGEEASIRRRFSDHMTGPIGRLIRGEARPAMEEGSSWEAAEFPERLFRTPWLRRQLQGVKGAMTRREAETRHLAVPYDPHKPFPLAPMFCLASVRKLGDRPYVIYTFNKKEWPVLRPEKN